MVDRSMTGSRLQRLWKTARAGVHSPGDAWWYFQHLPAWNRRLIDLELPWFSYGAIRFLRHWLRPHHRVFEYGGGGSSFFFAHHAGAILSVEGDAAWHGQILQAASLRGLANLRCELHPLDDANVDEYRANPYFHRIAGERHF